MPASVASLTVGSSAVAGVGEDDDHVDLLGDVGAHVGDRLGRVAARRGVDDLLDVGIGQRLGDELHLGDLAPDVLAEAVGVGDGQRAVAGLADRVLPALQRQLALLRRQAGGGALERLGDHRLDVLGGAERLHHQFFVCRRGAWREAGGEQCMTAPARPQRGATSRSSFVHDFLPCDVSCCLRARLRVVALYSFFFSQG